MIKFTVYGEPRGKGRPHFNRKNGIAYTPASTRQAERDFLSQAIQYKPKEPLNGALSIELTFYLAIPASKPKKWREGALNGSILPAKKPDIDNLIKSVLDPMNSIFFQDDKQIIWLTAAKLYSVTPRTKVEIEEAVTI